MATAAPATATATPKAAITSLLTRHLATLGGAPRGLGADNPIAAYLASAFSSRPCNDGPPKHSAMPARLRDRYAWFEPAVPTLHHMCHVCKAEFPNQEAFGKHQDTVHGGRRW